MKVWCAVLLLLFWAALPAQAAPEMREDTSLLLDQAFSSLDAERVNRFIGEMNRELDGDRALPALTLDTVKEIVLKGIQLDFSGALNLASRCLFDEFVRHAGLMGKLLFLSVLCAMLQNLQSSFARPGISALSYSVCFAFLSVIALHAFYEVMEYAVRTVGHMVSFMEALLPLMLTLLAGVGALTSAALLSPIMLMTVSAIGIAVKNVVLPLLWIGAALECATYLSERYQLGRLAGLFKQSGMLALGFIMMLFIGFITVQGTAGAISDGLALRTAKFATAAFVPVVGKVFADTVELVMGASLLLKNAVGIFGVLTVGAICFSPLVKMFALIFVMKLTGALVEPLGDAKMAQCLTSMGNTLLLAAGAVLTAALMFFLAIVMIVGAGGAAMMLRG